jgi:hypothetical protein
LCLSLPPTPKEGKKKLGIQRRKKEIRLIYMGGTLWKWTVTSWKCGTVWKLKRYMHIINV